MKVLLSKAIGAGRSGGSISPHAECAASGQVTRAISQVPSHTNNCR